MYVMSSYDFDGRMADNLSLMNCRGNFGRSGEDVNSAVDQHVGLGHRI
jgi:hypothetical protein